jgi:predicted nuclease of predicted toxin-antitoxin system
MALGLYMDHNVRRAVTTGLRVRDVDVLTAFEDGHHTADDPDLLDRARELGRVLFSQDEDLLEEAVRRQRAGVTFSGLTYCRRPHPRSRST